MHAFTRNGKKENQYTVEAGEDCYLCIGTRVVVRAPVECWDAFVLETLGKNTAQDHDKFVSDWLLFQRTSGDRF